MTISVNRSYSSAQSRFTSVDPAQDGSNLYAYANNDPVNNVDPTGLNASSGCSAEFGSCGGGFDWNNPYSSGGSGFSGGGFDDGWAYEGMSSELRNSVMEYEQRLRNTYDAINANRYLQKFIRSEGTDAGSFLRFLNIYQSNSTLMLQVSLPNGFKYVQRDILRVFGAGHPAGQNGEFRILRTDVALIQAIESAALIIFQIAQRAENWRQQRLSDPTSNEYAISTEFQRLLNNAISLKATLVNKIKDQFGDESTLLFRDRKTGKVFESTLGKDNLGRLVDGILSRAWNIGILTAPKPKKRGVGI